MKPKNNYKYTITDRLGTYEVEPLGEGEFSLDYERENDDKLDYKINLSGKIVLVKTPYNRVMQMEGSVYRCDEQTLSVSKDCGGVLKPIFTGQISLNDAEFNLDKCKVILKTLDDARDKCINDGKSSKVNLMQLIYNRIIVKNKSYNGVIETKTCSTNSPAGGNGENPYYWCGSGQPEDGNWTCVSAMSQSPDGVHFHSSNVWKREIIEIDCSETPDPNWVLVEDNCATTGKKKYAQGVTLYNCSSSGTAPDEFGSYSYQWSCSVLGYDGNTYQIDNGLHFTDVMKELVKASCPNLTVKSDFFQINPDNISGTNYVTNKASRVNNIIVFQKSDVKRPNASGNASKLEISLEKMLEVLKTMFNVKWRIEGNFFRLEHISYFQKNNGFNITTSALKKYFVGKRIYTYESEKIPQKEVFDWKEKGENPDWKVEVEYSGCVTNKKDNIKSYVLDDVMTDVVYAMANPDPDSNKVDDQGFVLVSTKKINNEYFINTENSPNGSRLNNVFAFAQLFRDYQYYERPMKRGKVNGTQTQFISTIPTKKGEKFAIPLCPCNTDFNPDDFITTALGEGIVSGARFRFKDEMLELDLLYESNQDLVPNAPPTLTGGGVFITYDGVPINIPISATDTDGFITSVQAVYPPNHGTISINSTFTQLTYTPNPGFVGYDFFSLRAFDNYQEISAIVNFGIEIKPANQPPVAVNDSFNVFVGQNFNQQISIFANDTDDYGSISLVNSSVVSAQGVTININSNGFFSYVPPAGFTGQDSFQYTIKDDLNQTSTATVTLYVTNYDYPVAVQDRFQTKINTQLVTDGSLMREKLTANDYTPNGQNYTYTCLVENKPTAQGGSVSIQSNGLMTYTPPNGFTGIDQFNYTVQNPNGSGVGLVKISVLPQIYIKIVRDDVTERGHYGDEFFSRTADYTLYFYSDAGGTQPLNVTGLGLKVKIRKARTYNNPSGTSTGNYVWITDECSGTSYKFYDDYQWYDSSDYGTYTSSTTISILTDNSYNII